MSKAVLISIKPEWCSLIASGEKTIEVRKTRPRLETPFKCYIYCTIGKYHARSNRPEYALFLGDGKECANGKVIGEFVCDEVEEFAANPRTAHLIQTERIARASKLGMEALVVYGLDSPHLYSWHISDLVIYPEPKELTEFFRICEEFRKGDPQCGGCDYYRSMGEYPPECDCDGVRYLYRPPQSWCYVEDVK